MKGHYINRKYIYKEVNNMEDIIIITKEMEEELSNNKGDDTSE